MNLHLGIGDRVLVVIANKIKKHARIKDMDHTGAVSVSYSGTEAVEPGAPAVMEHMHKGPKCIYYLKVSGMPPGNQPLLRMQRSPIINLNRQRRSWRVAFTQHTGIRLKNAPHFLNAQFRDLSMEGARIVSEASFPISTEVEVRLPIPEVSEYIVTANIVRVSQAPVSRNTFGQALFEVVVLFKNLNGQAYSQLTHYMWRCVRKTYGDQMRQVYDIDHHRPKKSEVRLIRQPSSTQEGKDSGAGA